MYIHKYIPKKSTYLFLIASKTIEAFFPTAYLKSRLSPRAKFKMALKLKEVQRKRILQSFRKILGFL
jgi:hypothetical protein